MSLREENEILEKQVDELTRLLEKKERMEKESVELLETCRKSVAEAKARGERQAPEMWICEKMLKDSAEYLQCLDDLEKLLTELPPDVRQSLGEERWFFINESILLERESVTRGRLAMGHVRALMMKAN